MSDNIISHLKNLDSKFKARADGARAYEQGIAVEDCPHTDDLFKNEWIEGWRERAALSD